MELEQVKQSIRNQVSAQSLETVINSLANAILELDQAKAKINELIVKYEGTNTGA